MQARDWLFDLKYMKKSYFEPTIETADINPEWRLCAQGTAQDNDSGKTDPTPGFAPAKVF